CRALGADIVIAVDLSWGKLGPYRQMSGSRSVEIPPPQADASWIQRVLRRRPDKEGEETRVPSIFEVFNTSLDIVEQRVARSRLAGEPADVLITPLLPDFGTMEYHRAKEAIAEGRAAVGRMMPLIERVIL